MGGNRIPPCFSPPKTVLEYARGGKEHKRLAGPAQEDLRAKLDLEGEGSRAVGHR